MNGLGKSLRKELAVVLAVILSVGVQSAFATNSSDALIKESDAYVQEMMETLQIVGLNYAVLIDGKLVHRKTLGLANSELRAPMSHDNLFPVASISKLFSSTALHVLLKSKNRSLDETVGDYLPDRDDLPEAWERVKLRQLLSHTSGIPDQIDYGVYLAPESRDFVIASLKDKPFSSMPGEANKYNATGFLLVQMIIEKLSNQKFETHMQEHYFDRFKLTSANYAGYKTVIANRVTSYRVRGENFELFPLNYSSPMFAGAGLNISISDLISWMQAVLNEKILTKEHFASIWAPEKLNSGKNGIFGLGWNTHELDDNLWITGHGGAGISTLRHFWKKGEPGAVTIILLTNGARNWEKMPDEISIGIANIFLPTNEGSK